MLGKKIKRNASKNRSLTLGMITALICIMTGFISAATLDTEQEDEANNGEDFTKPVNRFDVRLQLKTLPDDTESHETFDDRSAETLTLRTDWVLSSKPDQVYLRFDLPYVWSNKTNAQNKSGAVQSGWGDFLAQAAYVRTFNSQWAAGAGMQMIFPTATGEAFGNGKLQLAPTVAVRREFPEIGTGSYSLFVLRQFVSVSGDKDRSNINYLQVQPGFNLNLPNNWFLNSSPKINYYFYPSRWFVPLDLMVGKKFGIHWVVSVEYQYGLIRSSDQYQQWVEARVGYFF